MISIKKDERGKVFLLSTMIAILYLGYSIGWAAVHTILVKRVGVEYLPYTYIIMSFFTVLGSFIYLMFADRWSREKILRLFTLAAGILIIASRILITNHFEAIQELNWKIILFFSIVLMAQGASGSTLVMQVWTIINDIFLPQQGRRLYPLFGAANLAGGVLGGLLLQRLAAWIGMGNSVVVWGICLLFIVPLSYLLERWHGRELWKKATHEKEKNVVENLKDGFGFLSKSTLAKILAAMCILFWLTYCIQDFQYTKVMNLTFPTESSLSEFYGKYNIAFNVTAIILQLTAARVAIHYIGVFRGLWFLPIVGILGFIALMIQFEFWEAFLFRFSWDVTGMMIQSNAYQLSLNAFPSTFKARVRGFLEGIVNPFGLILGGSIILLIQLKFLGEKQLSSTYQNVLNISGLVLSSFWFTIVFKGRSSYIQTLIRNISQGDRLTQLHALESLQERNDPIAFQTLSSILSDRSGLYDEELKTKAIEVLSHLENSETIRMISSLLDSSSVHLRVHALSGLRRIQGIKKHPFVHFFLYRKVKNVFNKDPHLEVRIEAGHFLIENYKGKDLPRFIQALWNLDDVASRILAIQTLSKMKLEMIETLLEEGLHDRHPEVQAEAIIALWNAKNAREKCRNALFALLNSSNDQECELGLKASFLIGAPSECSFRAKELFTHPDIHIKTLAYLVYLSSSEPKNDILAKKILLLLTEPQYSTEKKEEMGWLLSKCKEEVLDTLFLAMMTLTEEEHQKLRKDLEEFTYNYYENTISK